MVECPKGTQHPLAAHTHTHTHTHTLTRPSSVQCQPQKQKRKCAGSLSHLCAFSLVVPRSNCGWQWQSVLETVEKPPSPAQDALHQHLPSISLGMRGAMAQPQSATVYIPGVHALDVDVPHTGRASRVQAEGLFVCHSFWPSQPSALICRAISGSGVSPNEAVCAATVVRVWRQWCMCVWRQWCVCGGTVACRVTEQCGWALAVVASGH